VAKENTVTTDELFLAWWAESYPSVKPAPHTVFTHVAFADYIDQVRTKEVLDAISRSAGDDT